MTNILEEIDKIYVSLAMVKEKIMELENEVELDDKLIAERDLVVNEFSCPTHGPCIPYALQEIRKLKRRQSPMNYTTHQETP